jgi:hypothetical protein
MLRCSDPSTKRITTLPQEEPQKNHKKNLTGNYSGTRIAPYFKGLLVVV